MSAAPVTEQGRATRERIVRAAAELIAERGAAATTWSDAIRGALVRLRDN
jgi:DNA-binding transcriptional regulator YbjK